MLYVTQFIAHLFQPKSQSTPKPNREVFSFVRHQSEFSSTNWTFNVNQSVLWTTKTPPVLCFSLPLIVRGNTPEGGTV